MEKGVLLWRFERLGTLRRKLIQRAGRLTRPRGKLTLTMSANPTVKSELLHYVVVLKRAAWPDSGQDLCNDPVDTGSPDRWALQAVAVERGQAHRQDVVAVLPLVRQGAKSGAEVCL